MPFGIRRDLVRAYLGEHLGYFALVGLLFAMGIIFGSLTVNRLAPADQQNLLEYLRGFISDFHATVPLRGATLAREAIWNNVRTLGFLFILGITAVGTPLILLVVFTRGFILGFTVGFLVKQLLFKGFFFALMSVIPHNFLLVPAILLAAVANIDFGVILIQSRLSRKPVQLGREFVRCLVLTGIALVALILAGLVEGYISPVLIGMVAKNLS